MTDNRLKDRIALIVGGSSGLGKATAFKYANSGARIAIADLRSTGVEEQIKEQHGEAAATFIQCDVTQESDVVKMIEQVVQWAGRLDILCNFAGVLADHADGGPARCHTLATELFDQTLAVNCRGLWLCCKYALTQMMAQEPREPNARGDWTRGWIVNTASVVG
jgi:NAD(P)-dependent dehydrogenase (short-subunit alcohol dehydrogenase family)